MQQVLHLRGDDYTFEDFKRDLLSFEEDQKLNKDTEDMVAKRKLEEDVRALKEHQSRVEQILQELGSEEKEDKERKLSEIVKSEQENLEQLGIKMNQVGVKSPNFVRVNSKRGRRSIKGRREVDGQA